MRQKTTLTALLLAGLLSSGAVMAAQKAYPSPAPAFCQSLTAAQCTQEKGKRIAADLLRTQSYRRIEQQCHAQHPHRSDVQCINPVLVPVFGQGSLLKAIDQQITQHRGQGAH